MASRTVYQVLAETARIHGDAPALRQPSAHGYLTYSWNEYRRAVEEIAAGLRAIGICPGDVVALNSETRLEFYIADIGNKRIQVFDAQGAFKSAFSNVGTPRALCMTGGSTQYLYIAHAGDEDGMEDAAIFKVQLDGKVVGRFGSAGKLPKQFGLVNSLDCRSESQLLVGELTNWRVQKITIR